MLSWLTAWDYRFIEVPTLLPETMFRSATEGTENRVFDIGNRGCLHP